MLSLALCRITQKIMKVETPVGFAPPQVIASTATPSTISASSWCSRVCSAKPARRQPVAPAGQGVRRGPVT